MKTNIFLYPIILLLLCTSACAPKHYFFSSKTTDFDCFKTTQKVSNNQLKTWKQGLYLFTLKVEEKEVDGIRFKWYSRGEVKDLENTDTTIIRNRDRTIIQEVKKEHAYFLFLDDSRVYYYSSYRKKKVKAPRKVDNAYCCVNACPDSNPKSFQPAEAEKYDYIDRDIVLNQKYDLYKMRGYYEVYNENYVKIELERPQKRRNARRGKKEIIKFDFKLVNDTLIMQPLEVKRKKARSIKGIDENQRIDPEKELAIIPKFIYTEFGSKTEDRIKLLFVTSEKKELNIKHITRDLEKNLIRYSLYNDCEIKEDISNTAKVFTW